MAKDRGGFDHAGVPTLQKNLEVGATRRGGGDAHQDI
jgi:hypothetical protein